MGVLFFEVLQNFLCAISLLSMQLGAAERTRHPAVTIITHLCVLWFEFRYISVSCECFLHAHFSGSVGSVDLGRNSELHACFDVFADSASSLW